MNYPAYPLRHLAAERLPFFLFTHGFVTTASARGSYLVACPSA